MSRLFDLALLAWPREARRRDGALVVDTATQLIEAGYSSRRGELASIVRSGLSLRLSRNRFASAPWTDAAALLLAPLLLVLLIGAFCQMMLVTHGFPVRIFSPGFSTTLLIGLVLLTLAASALSRRRIALLSSLGALLVLVGRIYRAEVLGSWPGVMQILGFNSGLGFDLKMNADPALLPPLALSVFCCLALRKNDQVAHILPVGIVGALALLSFWVAWEATGSGARWSGDMIPGQAPVMFLLWLAPILFFVAAFVGRASEAVRLAASLGLAVAGPTLAWLVAGLPAFYGWPDTVLLLFMISLQGLWITVMLAGIRSTTSPSGRPATD